MSRCFAYPPPGYSLSRNGKGTLIDTIKLQTENESAKDKEIRKEKKREKKEKSKEKKERRREKKEKKEREKEKKNNPYQNLNNSDVSKLQTGEKSWACTKIEFPLCQAESEHLERSTISEEHGPPVFLRTPTSSFDSTENSNKRKRQSSTGDVARDRGRVIRIRLSKKQSEPTVSVNEQQLCSTSGRTEIPCQGEDRVGPSCRNKDSCSITRETSILGRNLAPINGGGSSSRVAGRTATLKTGIPPVVNTVITPMQRVELQYKNLIGSWVPPPLHDVTYGESDDLDWLFKGKKNQNTISRGRERSGNDIVHNSSFSSSTSFPRAQYLTEVDVYALPYAVPF